MRKLDLNRERLYKIGRVRYLQKLFRRIIYREKIVGYFQAKLASNYRMVQAQNRTLGWALNLTCENPFLALEQSKKTVNKKQFLRSKTSIKPSAHTKQKLKEDRN